MADIVSIRGTHPAVYRDDSMWDTKKWESEEQLQAACFQWHWNTKLEERQMLFHIANGGDRPSKIINGKRVSIEATRLKAMGVVPGVADFGLITDRFGTVYIEMKLIDGVQSKEQILFEQKVTARGQMYLIRRSLVGFQFTINYLLTL